MTGLLHPALRSGIALLCACLLPCAAPAQRTPPAPKAQPIQQALSVTQQDVYDTSAANLIAVLRESSGASNAEEALRPAGKVRGTTENGREVEFEMSWFDFVGDIQVRLVFDGAQRLLSASPEDLQRLKLNPEQALELAISNLRRAYGAPAARPWNGTLMQVKGGSEDLDSSYFLDRAFWQELQQAHPEGIVAGVPRRGGLVYAPLADPEAVEGLRFSAAALYASDERTRVSSALYLFKDGHWSLFQPPLTSFRYR